MNFLSNLRRVAQSVLMVAALVLGVSGGGMALAQTNTFEYEMRIVSNDVQNGSQLSIPGPVTLRFTVEARAKALTLATNNANHGVLRWSPRNSSPSDPSFIQVTDSANASILRRGVVVPAGPGGFPLTGRALLFRSGGPVDDLTTNAWHSIDLNGTGGSPFPSSTGNQFGAFDLGSTRLHGIDATVGPSRSGTTNPWVADFPTSPIGTFSPWRTLYHFDLVITATTPRTIRVTAAGLLAAGVRAQNIGGGVWLMNLANSTTAGGTLYAISNFVLASASFRMGSIRC